MSEVKPLPWELPPVNIVHDPALDMTFVDPFAKFAAAVAPKEPNPLLVRDSVTGLLPGQADPLDVPTFLRRCKP